MNQMKLSAMKDRGHTYNVVLNNYFLEWTFLNMEAGFSKY
jgi:hypothetical protein